MDAILVGILALAVLPGPQAPQEYTHCDLVEVNHYQCSSNGFTQVVWWDLLDGEYHVVAWRMLRGVVEDRKRPRRKVWVGGHACPERRNGKWVSQWTDDHKGYRVRRVVTADAYRESWTDYDPELDDRRHFDVSERRGL